VRHVVLVWNISVYVKVKELKLTLIVYSTTLDPYDSDAMAREFLAQFHHMSFTVGQQLVFSFQEKKLLALSVKELEGKKSSTERY